VHGQEGRVTRLVTACWKGLSAQHWGSHHRCIPVESWPLKQTCLREKEDSPSMLRAIW